MKSVLITGGNRGIGLEICRQFDKLGWQVILCSRDINKGKKSAITLSNNVTIKKQTAGITYSTILRMLIL